MTALDDGGDVVEVADTHFLLVGDEGGDGAARSASVRALAGAALTVCGTLG